MSKQELELPKGWAEISLENCADILDGKRIPINSKERAKRTGKIPYYGATGQVGLIDDFIFDEELMGQIEVFCETVFCSVDFQDATIIIRKNN